MICWDESSVYGAITVTLAAILDAAEYIVSLNLILKSPVSNSDVPDVRETTNLASTTPSLRLFSSIIAKSPCKFVILSPCS